MNSLSSSGHGIIGSGIALAVVASISVFLRLIAKRETKMGFAFDDYWIGFALLIFWIYVGVELRGIYIGAGGANMDNFRTANLSGIQIFYESIRVDIALFALTITGVKLSILSLYNRVFSIRWFRRATVALGGVCALWLLALILCSVFACFGRSSPHCIDFSTFYLILGLVEMLIEIAILGLPVWSIASLQLSLRDKVIVLITFLVGSFVCITGIVRLGLTYRPGGQFDIMKCMLWSNIQLGAAIPGACLITYRPLLSKLTLLLTRLFRSSSSSQPASSLIAFRNQSSRNTHNNSNKPIQLQSSSNPRTFFGGGAKEERQKIPSEVDMTEGHSTKTRTFNDEGDRDWPLDGSRTKSPVEIV